jgi:hypothetical protein
MAGRGAAPAGLATQAGHSGGAGASPGTTTGPCQELTDDLASRSPCLLPAKRGKAIRKRGPACKAKDAANDMRSSAAEQALK